MSLPAPDRHTIEQELDKLLARPGGGRVLGFSTPVARDWPPFIERQGVRFDLAWCASELAVRECLDGVGEHGVVILTPLDAGALGCDVVARMPRGRLVQPDRWDALRSAFKASRVDARLRTEPWLVDLLLGSAPLGGYAPVAGGVLDGDTAWEAMAGILGFGDGRADVDAVLAWTLDNRALARFATLPDDARRGVAARLAASGGAATTLVMRAVAAGRGSEALPLGLVCGVVFGTDEQRPELRDAAVRLEPLVGGALLVPDAGKALAAAARRVLASLGRSDPAAWRGVDARATRMLSGIGAAGEAGLSAALELGLDARMEAAAAALVETAGGDVGAARRAWALVRHAAAHDRAADRSDRMDRLWMAARLACFLALPEEPAPRTMAGAARWYAGDGGFVDWARHSLCLGDELPAVAAAYAALRGPALARREAASRAFAMLLQDWMAGAPGTMPNHDPLPVERMLDAVVAPLAREAPVLLLVMDGLSFPVWRMLSDSIASRGWTALQPKNGAGPVGMAVLPSLTEVSRASLMSGTLGRGDQAYERAHFRAHPALRHAGRGNEPQLFHKADLGLGPELDPKVHEALADPRQRVVGIVHNAVDAQLSGSDQLGVQWTIEVMRGVEPILRVARDAGRIVVVTGDHGNVMDEGTTRAEPGAGARWRHTGPAGEGEVALAGSRVVLPSAPGQMAGGAASGIVATWSETLRNGMPRTGYHGGASPQEVLVPVAVLCAAALPPGWTEAAAPEPAWWHGSTDVVPDAPIPDAPARRARTRLDPAGQAGLFAEAPPERVARAAGLPWIEALMGCGTYVAQRRLAGRGAPHDDQVRRLLAALASRGGRLPEKALAGAMAEATVRMPGIVNAVRRVLNLDQAVVLGIEGEEVVLNLPLLRQQFELDG